MNGKSAILIAGATASGKSSYALECAQRHRGTIINADAMQVYAELRVLTARPTAADEAVCPHRLYGHVPASRAYSVGQWLRDAQAAMDAVRAEGRLPIFVGGTGLYFKALLEGLSPIPTIPADIRAHWRRQAEALDARDLHHSLAAVDPVSARRLAASDKQRVVRALEVHAATGRTLSDWQMQPGRALLAFETVEAVIISRPRAALYARCDARLVKMIANGGLEEAAALAGQGLEPGLPALRALGVPQLMAHVRGEMDLEAALALAQMETRRYVKRQLSWQRRHMIAWNAIEIA